ncbi:MAG TPA: hypothetical protein VLD37_07575 [Candidatus Bilamarchaeum sp.]|nr:hypothetical protein [Candidatus Bilamarchaeum sp.]
MHDDGTPRERAIATLDFLAYDGEQEAGRLVGILREGKTPEAVSDGLFAELMEMAGPKELAAYHRFEATVSELRREGRHDLAERGEGRRGRIMADARTLESLAKLGFIPSPEQRAALFLRFRAMLEIASKEGDDLNLRRALESSREVLRETLFALSHAFGKEECAFMLEISDQARKLAFIGGWMERAAYQSDIAKLFEGELSGILGGKGRDSGARVQAYAMRERLRALPEKLSAPPERPDAGSGIKARPR